jgi:hypothetical protein
MASGTGAPVGQRGRPEVVGMKKCAALSGADLEDDYLGLDAGGLADLCGLRNVSHSAQMAESCQKWLLSGVMTPG